MSHDDFDFEPIRGLPAALPAGERLLWQGTPNWKALAIRAYHVRKVAIYFLLIAAWRIVLGVRNGHEAFAVMVSCAFILGLGCIAVAVLSLLAYFNARSTVYSITSRRALLRHGIAVPMTMNLPFKMVDSADLKSFRDGTGDIYLAVPKQQRLGYLITWPHLRPGRFARPSASFRALPDAARAAGLLGAALAAENGGSAQPTSGEQSTMTPSFGAHTAAA
jgi:hypothetical protein